MGQLQADAHVHARSGSRSSESLKYEVVPFEATGLPASSHLILEGFFMSGKDLRGFWNPPAGVSAGMASDRRAASRNMRKNAKKKNGKPSRQPIGTEPNEANFYRSLKWRQLRYLVLKNTDGRCQCCGACATDGVRIHVDHIKPRKDYPELSLSLDNVQVMCEDCNCGKGSWDSTDWRKTP